MNFIMKNFSKQLLIVVLAIFYITTVYAYDFNVNNIYYNILSQDKRNVEVTFRQEYYSVYNDDYAGDIIIPETVIYNNVEYQVTKIGEYAFKGCNKMTSISIPSNVTQICDFAFYACSGLRKLIIVDSNTTLSLGYNKNSGSMSVVGEGLFWDCSINTLYLGRNISFFDSKPYGYSPFYMENIGYSVLQNVTISNFVSKIYANTFYCCKYLKNITIPNSVTSIGSNAFYSCSGLTSITIPNSVTSIGISAFENCQELKNITIGSGVKRVAYNAFKTCNLIEDIYVYSKQPFKTDSDSSNPYNCYINGRRNATLHIPYGSANAYKSHPDWNQFANYVEFNQPNNPAHQPVKLYMPDIIGAISRWECSRDGGATWTNIECESVVYTEMDPVHGEVLYRALKTDGTYGDILTINYYDPVPEVIATAPANETKTVDESVTFTLNVLDDGYTYQWMHNDNAIEGATKNTYSISAIKMKDAGKYYCVVSNPVSSINSSTSTIVVSKCPQVITFPEIETKTFGDEAFTLPATTDKGLTINYQSTNTNVAIVEGNVVTIKEPGETNIIATQAGNDDYLEAAYVSRKLTVKKVSQTIVLNELQDKTFEDIPFMLPATTDKGLTISYQSTNTNVATIEGNVVTIVGAGTTDIIATQQGDEHHYATTPVSRTFTVNRQTQSITFNAFGNVVYGDAQIELNQYTNKNFEITYTSSNTDVATVDGNIISVIKPGLTVIKAIQNGNKNYLPAQSIERTLIVNKADQKIEWYELPAKNYGDGDFALPATTDKGLTITYTSDNENVATISGNIVSIKNAGSANITATQSGDDYYNAATPVTHKLTVSKIAQTITFEELQAMTFGDAPMELNATANSSRGVLFESSNDAVATISGNVLTIVGAGKCTIVATCAGDNNHYAATPVERELVVNKAKQTISISSVGAKTYGDGPFELEIITSNNQPVTISSSNASILSVNGKVATIRGAGIAKITATQEATANYEKAQTDIDVVISKAKLTATVSDAERVYGDANPNFEITYSGFVNGETKEDLDVMPVAMCSATEFSNVGEYDITINNVSNKNYILDIRNAKLTIKKALLTVAADNRTKIYGEKNPALSVSYSGFKNNENETILLSSAVAFTDAKTMSNVGEYVIMVEGANSINYYFEYNQGVFVIEKAPLIITAENKSINYQDEIPEFTILYDGFAGSDSEADLDELPQIVCDITNETMPGTYDIVLSGGYDNNYEYVLVDGIIVINNTTGITNIESGSEKNVVYNLKGQRVIDTENLTRGFYIINGKKVFIK